MSMSFDISLESIGVLQSDCQCKTSNLFILCAFILGVLLLLISKLSRTLSRTLRQILRV